MCELIFASLEPWDDVWRRNQFVCAELARRYPERKILFVTPQRDMSNAVRRMEWGRLRATAPWSPQGLPNIVVFTPTKWLPNSVAAGREVNAAGLRRQIIAEARRLNLHRPVLWVNDHSAAHLAGRLGEAGLVYDVTDDWISFDQSPALRERTRAQDAELCRRADATIVCSQRLYELKTPLVPAPSRLHLIPNGVHAEHYATVADRSLPTAEATHGWPRPVYGYTGTVHPDRVDVDLVEAVARRLTAGCMAFVGPNHLSATDRRRLTETGRVVFHPPVAYQDIPAYMRAMDVLIVPHRMSEFVESLNPIKLWEYLASGLPVVSTDVAGFRDFPSLVRVARSPESFHAAMLAALGDEASERVACRQEAVAAHTWAARVDVVETVVGLCEVEQQSSATSTIGVA